MRKVPNNAMLIHTARKPGHEMHHDGLFHVPHLRHTAG